MIYEADKKIGFGQYSELTMSEVMEKHDEYFCWLLKKGAIILVKKRNTYPKEMNADEM